MTSKGTGRDAAVRIGIDARFLLRPLRGMPHYVLGICRHMPALRPDYRFTFFINRAFEHNESPEAYGERLDGLAEAPNVDLVNMDDEAEMYWEQVLLPAAVRRQGIDLLHMPGNRIAFRAGVPVVVTVHDLMELSYLGTEHAAPAGASLRTRVYFWRRRAYVWLVYRHGFRRAARIITVSDGSRREIVEGLGIPPERVVAIHHGIEPHFRVSGRGEIGNLRERKHCLMFGGDSLQKNPEGALRAWAAVPEELRRRFPLRIVGFCGSETSPLLRALRELGLEGEVTVTGWIDTDGLVRALQESALLLFLSRREGFGFPLLEAMACGTPVVCSDIPSLAEIAGSAAAVVVAPDDAAGAAAGMARLLSSPQDWAQSVAQGRERAAEFSWQESAEKHLRVYESVLQSTPATHLSSSR
jgi:glycosyltransferase involved in cell wall biosynthesis